MLMKALAEKTILITGATAGIGLATVQALCARGAQVLGVGRSAERCAQAEAQVRAVCPQARVRYYLADLSSQRQVRQLAAKVQADVPGGALDVLMNNAGAVATQRTLTEDGYELQFAVNHLAPFLLSNLLLPALQRSGAGRVLTVSSASHRWMGMIWGDVMLRRWYHSLLAYKQSKLANVLFTVEFNRRFAGQGVRAFAVDPGLVNTEIGLKGMRGLERWFWEQRRKGGTPPEQPAQTLVYLAEAQDVEPAPYWKDCKPLRPSPYALRPEAGARLWALSAQLCGLSH